MTLQSRAPFREPGWSIIQERVRSARSVPRERVKRKDPERGPHERPFLELLATLREWHKVDDDKAMMVCEVTRDLARSTTRERVEKYQRTALQWRSKHSSRSWRSAF
jgi:hypothetical protein